MHEYEEGLKSVGQAYGFFDCRTSKEEVEREIAGIPHADLELSLIQGEGMFLAGMQDSQLKEIVPYARRDIVFSASDTRSYKEKLAACDDAQKRPFQYVIEATHIGRSNRGTAEDLSFVLNSLYRSSLYQKGEPFRGVVLFIEGGEYGAFE